ncbi:MAG: DegT/DnrJ/EryC1/StrS family aminotransferase, partial [Oscillospiraceae bacterium]
LPAAELRRMSLHGQDRDALVRRGGVSVEYDIVTLGYKANMTDLQAAVGLSQLLRYRAMISQRRFLTKRYEAGLPNGWSCLAHTPGWSAHLMMALMPEQAASRRNALFAQLLRQGIHANIHYRPLPLMTVYRRMGWREDNCPNAIALYEREVSLPLSSVMTVQEADFVLDCLHQFSEATGPF